MFSGKVRRLDGVEEHHTGRKKKNGKVRYQGKVKKGRLVRKCSA